MKRPNLLPIIELLEKGEDFELTNQQYKKKTDVDFPKDKYYAKNRSAVAKIAAKYNYKIEIIPQRVQFVKIL